MNLDMGSMKMLNAVREYEKGTEKLTAMVIIGNQMMEQGQMHQMNLETEMWKVKIITTDDFKVHTHYDKAENSGCVIVLLSKNKENSGIFTLYFEGISEDDARKLAKTFDWKKMKKSVDKLF